MVIYSGDGVGGEGDSGDADRDSYQIVGKGKKVIQIMMQNKISQMAKSLYIIRGNYERLIVEYLIFVTIFFVGIYTFGSINSIMEERL